MAAFRQYPQASYLLATDAYIIDRAGVGTMYVDSEIIYGQSTITVSQNIVGPALLNIYESGGLFYARYANAATDLPAHGFIMVNAPINSGALVQFAGVISGLSGLTSDGPAYLSASVPGGVTSVAPTTAGQISQQIGIAIGTTAVAFNAQMAIGL